MDVEPRGNFLNFPARYVFAVLGSIGMAIAYGLKVNLSVAMVGMLNHTALKGNDSSITTDAESDGPFVWSSDIQGAILSGYFWGYLVSQIPGGRMAEVFSAKWVMFFSVMINIVCTLLTPVMVKLHYIALVIMRVLEGIGGGATFPAMHVMLSKWVPPEERSRMAAFIYGAGTSLGTVISMSMTGVLIAFIGWESVFYVMGGLSLIWCFLWVVLVEDSPQWQRFISAEERDMIITSLGGKAGDNTKKKLPVPWRAVLTSAPFLAILVTHTCANWGWYMMLIELPFYMKQVLKFKITQNAVAAAVPFLTLWIFSMVVCRMLDWLCIRKTITISTARKIATLLGSVVPALCLLILCFIEYNPGLAVAIVTVAITFMGSEFCGFISNHIDIAPNFAGTLIGLTNTVATVPGIVVPNFVSAVTHNNQTISAWRIIFFVTIGLYVIEILVYTIFGSGEEQPWNKGASEI